MDLSASTPVVTGAGCGLGRHLVDGLLEQGAAKVYALARDPSTVRNDPRVFVPVLETNGGGQIVNVLSLLGLASTAPMTGYSASKAAAHSLTQALRPVLAAKRITVHGVYPGGIDSDMLAGIDAPKTPPAEVASGILAGLAADREDIFPDPNAEAMSQIWWSDPKAFERAFAQMATAS
jgi:NAD(P)-dependent dehydrogenase (short-subunit alcohol dehydrogenase family)